MLTDPIADMLTRLRNASMVGHAEATLPYSKIKEAILQIMAKRGFIAAVKAQKNGDFKELVIELKPKKVLNITRKSTPGHRNYTGKADLHSVQNGMGIGIISTSQGIMTTNEAKNAGIGGELICEIY